MSRTTLISARAAALLPLLVAFVVAAPKSLIAQTVSGERALLNGGGDLHIAAVPATAGRKERIDPPCSETTAAEWALLVFGGDAASPEPGNPSVASPAEPCPQDGARALLAKCTHADAPRPE